MKSRQAPKTNRVRNGPPAGREADRWQEQFTTTLHQAGGKNATGVIIPDDVIGRLGNSKRLPVRVSINGYEFRTTTGVMGGLTMIGVSAAIRKETGLIAGDGIDVALAVDESPRTVDVPADFRGALDSNSGTGEFFNSLSNSLQRFHVDNINAAKTDETR